MIVTEDILTINFQRGRKGPYPPDTLVLHVTEGSAESARQWFHDPSSRVSAHYMVTKTGTIYHFVHESDTAWANGRVDNPTAQVVKERVGTNPNAWTISIEHEGDGTHELTDPQRAASLELMKDIQTRHHRIVFNRHHVLGHREIYALKTCPGAIDVDRLVRELNELPPTEELP